MTIWGGPGYLAHTTMIIPKRHTHKHCLFLSRSHSDIVCKEHTQPHTNAPPTDDCKLFPIIHRPHLDEYKGTVTHISTQSLTEFINFASVDQFKKYAKFIHHKFSMPIV